MVVNMLIDDIIVYLMTFLNDIGKIYFLSITKVLHSLKNKIQFNEIVHYNNIYDLSYFDMFTNIIISSKFELDYQYHYYD